MSATIQDILEELRLNRGRFPRRSVEAGDRES